MKNGFTLVELSIVLVIIGLLIGGILVGQSLIDSAKIGAGVRQLQQYDIATSNFRTKYKQYPGDTNRFAPLGNNDNDIIDDVTGGMAVCGVSNCQEWMSFWKHLSDSNMINKSYTNDWTGTVPRAGINVPIFMGTFLKASTSTADAGVYRPKGWIYQSNYEIKWETMLALDSKMDDGAFSTGSVRGYSSSTLAGCASGNTDCVGSFGILGTQGSSI